jgi:regulatory protein YycH of two-component signal transduction system YycFG
VQEKSKNVTDFIISATNVNLIVSGEIPTSIFVLVMEVERECKKFVPEGTNRGVIDC